MAQRRNSNVTRRGAADEYTVYIKGVCLVSWSWTRYSTFGRQLTWHTDKLAPTTTWKELKDLARLWLGEPIRRTEEEVKRILGRVEVYQNSGMGYIPVKGEQHGREIQTHASSCVCNGSKLIAKLEEGTSPAFQDSASTYRYFQQTVDSTFCPAGCQSPPSAYEEQTGNRYGAHLHWTETPLLWPHPSEYPGSGYVAGSWMLFEDQHVTNPGSSVSPWATSQLTLPGPRSLPVATAVLYSVPSTMPVDFSQPVPGPPNILHYARAAPFQLTHTNGDGTPVNISNGALSTEDRGVFIQNLSYEATSADVENLMRGAGPVVRCEVNTDTCTGRAKGSATVKFTTAEDATKALDIFNGIRFMGRQLTVRLDKNQEANSDAEAATGASSCRNEQEPIIC